MSVSGLNRHTYLDPAGSAGDRRIYIYLSVHWNLRRIVISLKFYLQRLEFESPVFSILIKRLLLVDKVYTAPFYWTAVSTKKDNISESKSLQHDESIG